MEISIYEGEWGKWVAVQDEIEIASSFIPLKAPNRGSILQRQLRRIANGQQKSLQVNLSPDSSYILDVPNDVVIKLVNRHQLERLEFHQRALTKFQRSHHCRLVSHAMLCVSIGIVWARCPCGCLGRDHDEDHLGQSRLSGIL